MERLTIRNSDGSVSQPTSTKVSAVFEKLAAYEDTELSPEDINDICYRFSAFLCEMTGNRMSKLNYTLEAMIDCARDAQESDCENYCSLKQADMEGRLVVLPCKVTETDIAAAKMVLSVIEHFEYPMLMYEIEKEAVRKALTALLQAEAALKGVSEDA